MNLFRNVTEAVLLFTIFMSLTVGEYIGSVIGFVLFMPVFSYIFCVLLGALMLLLGALTSYTRIPAIIPSALCILLGSTHRLAGIYSYCFILYKVFDLYEAKWFIKNDFVLFTAFYVASHLLWLGYTSYIRK